MLEKQRNKRIVIADLVDVATELAEGSTVQHISRLDVQ